MQSKRPFFLMEIVIAMVLVGIFSTYFLHSSMGHLQGERKALLDLEFERLIDLKRMELVSNNWQSVHRLPKLDSQALEETYKMEVKLAGKTYKRTHQFKVFCPKSHGNTYDLVIKEDKKKYHFLINLSETKA